MRRAKLGFRKEQMLTLATRERLEGGTQALKTELASLPGVMEVTQSSSVPGQGGWIWSSEGSGIDDFDGEWFSADLVWVDADFVGTMGLELAQGRAFDPARPGDMTGAVMLNEAAVRRLGWEDPVGKGFTEDDTRLEVIGVFRDFHTKSMKAEVGPMMLRLSDRHLEYTTLRLAARDLPPTVAAVRGVWGTFIPGLPFQYSFLDEDFDVMYRSEERLASLFGSFSILAILIAAMGLFGIAAHAAQQRTPLSSARRRSASGT